MMSKNIKNKKQLSLPQWDNPNARQNPSNTTIYKLGPQRADTMPYKNEPGNTHQNTTVRQQDNS